MGRTWWNRGAREGGGAEKGVRRWKKGGVEKGLVDGKGERLKKRLVDGKAEGFGKGVSRWKREELKEENLGKGGAKLG
jgi:hypothetical protein